MIRRVVAIGVVAAVTVTAVVLVGGALRSADGKSAVQRYADAWATGDTRTMYEQISPDSQGQNSYPQFKRKVDQARATATVRAIRINAVDKTGDSQWRVSSRISTRAFGTIEKPLTIPVEGSGDNARVKWSDALVFPGLAAGSSLTRETTLPARAFEVQLAGKPGGTLRAGQAIIATSRPRKGATVKTTINSRIQQLARTQMGSRQGGIVVIRPRSGEILGYAGAAFSGLQPPGSTFKIITLAGALEAGVVKPSDSFPVVMSTKLAGVEFENADRELCGGTLTESFAKSCNSVFGPLGAKLGATRLIDMAKRFGFDKKPAIQGAATSTMPNAETLDDDLQVGAASIGQSTVQASPLQMATVAATIALRGRRPELTLAYKKHGTVAPTTRVIDPATARTVERMMLAVVNRGTGEFAAIPGVKVAGKTGTAELRSTQECNPDELTKTTSTTTTEATSTTGTTTTETCPEDTTDDTTAWFTSYAPAGNPEVVVCVMFAASGQGRDTAAPAAKALIQAALGKPVTVPAPPAVAPQTAP